MSDNVCQECGMACEPGEYHPFAACLMFKGCHNSKTVRANLPDIAQLRQLVQKEEMREWIELMLIDLSHGGGVLIKGNTDAHAKLTSLLESALSAGGPMGDGDKAGASGPTETGGVEVDYRAMVETAGGEWDGIGDADVGLFPCVYFDMAAFYKFLTAFTAALTPTQSPLHPKSDQTDALESALESTQGTDGQEREQPTNLKDRDN